MIAVEFSKLVQELQRGSNAVVASSAGTSGRRATVVSRSVIPWKSHIRGIWEIATTALVQALSAVEYHHRGGTWSFTAHDGEEQQPRSTTKTTPVRAQLARNGLTWQEGASSG